MLYEYLHSLVCEKSIGNEDYILVKCSATENGVHLHQTYSF